ncbi:MAG: hypothetical protein ABSA86_04230 [Oryzomonas sp.]|jgi:hypothetical protein
MQGKILKIKTGYNPNSSSIGVDMVVFFTVGAAIAVLFNTMAAIICSTKAKEAKLPEESAETPSLGEEQECPE